MASLALERPPIDEFFDGEWLRKTFLMEEAYLARQREDSHLVWYQLNLKSKAPLTDRQVRTSLNHLYKKCPNLSVCIGVREGCTWVRRARVPFIDFQLFHDTVTIKEARQFMQHYQYNERNGPLFCGMLLLKPSDAWTDPDEGDQDLSHKSCMIFGFSPIFIDSSSALDILGLFIALLNDVIAGRPIKDDEEVGKFVDDEKNQRFIKRWRTEFRNNTKLETEYKMARYRYETKPPLIVNGFKPPNMRPETKTFEKIFDYNTTMRFTETCLNKDIHQRSVLSAIFNVSLIDLLVERGTVKEIYEIQSFYMCDLRRYWDPPATKALGMHAGYPLTIYKKTPRDSCKTFWMYADSLHDDIAKGLESAEPLMQQTFHAAMCSDLPYDKKSINPKYRAGDYLFNYLGDVTAKVTEEGKEARICHFLSCMTIHLSEHPLLIECHIYRSRLMMTFNYNTGLVSEDVMNRLFELVIRKIKHVAGL